MSYENNIVAQTSERLRDVVYDYIQKYPVEHCFETPNMQVLNDRLKEFDLKKSYIQKPGKMRSAKIERSWMFWG